MTQTDELTAADGAAKDLFGWSVAVSGNTAVVGAIEHEVNSHTGQGAAYLFVAPRRLRSRSPRRRTEPHISKAKRLGGLLMHCVRGRKRHRVHKLQSPAGRCLNTTTLGPHTLTVNAIDSDGVSASQSVSYNVVSPSSNSAALRGRPAHRSQLVRLDQPAPLNGEVELVICKSVSTGMGKHKKTIQKCTTKLTSSPITITATGGAMSAALSRGKVVYATGSAVNSGRQTKLLLTLRRTSSRATTR